MNRRIFSLLFVSALTCACAVPAADGPEGEGDVASSTEGLQALRVIRPLPVRTEATLVRDLVSEVEGMDSSLLVYLGSTDPLVRAIAIADVRTRLTRSINLSDQVLGVTTNPEVIAATTELRAMLVDASLVQGISEEMSLRLQMLMDRRAKVISTLANIMAKISETQDAIVGNIK